MRTLTLPRPGDWHLHLRDGAMLRAVLPASAAFGDLLAMPNLVPPVDTVEAARAYAARIAAAGPAPGQRVHLTAYLTDHTSPDELARGYAEGAWIAAKWYPANATTNAHHGVTHPDRIRAVLERMAELGMPLCVHGESTDRSVDVFDRERVFVDGVLAPLLDRLPGLRVVLEHVTTAHAAAFVRDHSGDIAATITPHHLWWSRNALFDGGLRPHAYCLPILKRESDRLALRAAATSGNPRFFAGSDSAPHAVHRKEQDCGCAGVFNAPTALSAWAEVFDEEGALDRLAGFVSEHGPRFYRIPVHTEQITLTERPWTPPDTLDAGEAGPVRIFLGGREMRWS